MNDEAVCRTAPATPGLLITLPTLFLLVKPVLMTVSSYQRLDPVTISSCLGLWCIHDYRDKNIIKLLPPAAFGSAFLVTTMPVLFFFSSHICKPTGQRYR